MDWPIEVIPDEDRLYYRVHQMYIRPDEIQPAAFTNQPKGSKFMSVDWAKYTTPEKTRARARKRTDNAVVQFVAGQVRAVQGQKVEHSPNQLEGNRSHSDVIGEKTPEVRTLLSRIYTLVIPLEQDPQEAESLNL
jgi:hypothetical protein